MTQKIVKAPIITKTKEKRLLTLMLIHVFPMFTRGVVVLLARPVMLVQMEEK